jgi:hypothetical protein
MPTIAIMPGRFHPFHKGHAHAFWQLVNEFGIEHSFVAISSKQEFPDSPFSSKDRIKMAVAAGIPRKNILVVDNPYSAKQYTSLFAHPESTVLVFGISEKDMQGDSPRFTFTDNSYMQPWEGFGETVLEHAYVKTLEVGRFTVDGYTIKDARMVRKLYARSPNKMAILRSLYGKYAPTLKPIFDKQLQLTEAIIRLKRML